MSEGYTVDYLWRNLRQPVRFSTAIPTLIDHLGKNSTFVELSPHPVLSQVCPILTYDVCLIHLFFPVHQTDGGLRLPRGKPAPSFRTAAENGCESNHGITRAIGSIRSASRLWC